MSKEDNVKTFIDPKFIWGPLPEPWIISKINPVLFVHRRNKPNITIPCDVSPADAVQQLLQAQMLPTSRFIFITHGFLSDGNEEWLQEMKDMMISEEDQTVAIVSWGQGANIGVNNYKQAAANTQAVGEWVSGIASAINELVPAEESTVTKLVKMIVDFFLSFFTRRSEFKNFKGSGIINEGPKINVNIWGVGHSLGAHLMGRAGQVSKVFTRITGLDPAGPCFQTENIEKRLSANDAKFVDVIHTDGKGATYYGTLVPLGTIDFYPNFGWAQPVKDDPDKKPFYEKTADEESSHSDDDEDNKIKAESELSPFGNLGTSHSRAFYYFNWSIKNRNRFQTNLVLDGTPSVEESWHNAWSKVTAVHRVKWTPNKAEMGYYADRVPNINPGNYYILTNAKEPWT